MRQRSAHARPLKVHMSVSAEDLVAAIFSPSPSPTSIAGLGLSLVHDTTAPLTSLSLLAAAGQRWLDSNPPAIGEARQCLAEIAAHTRALGELMRTLARLAVSPVPPTQFDLGVLLADVVGELKSALDQAYAPLWLDLPDDPVEIYGNAWQLRQVLLHGMRQTVPNLFRQDAGDAVHIRLAATDMHAIIEVRTVARRDVRQYAASVKTSPGALDIAVLDTVMRIHGASLCRGEPGTDQALLTFTWNRGATSSDLAHNAPSSGGHP